MTQSTVERSTEVVVDAFKEEPVRVLHVDDEPSFLKVTKERLETENAFEVETATSVEEALKRLKEREFDIVVSDYQMAEKDGLELLKELRESGNNIAFVMFTGKGREEVAIQALNLGADRYLHKTGEAETVYGELVHAIRQVVKAKKAEKAIREGQEKFERLFMNNPEAADYLDRDFRILDVNPRFEHLFGYSRDEIVGRRINDVLVPEEKLEEAEMLDKNAEKAYVYYETYRKRKDGPIIPVSISAAPIVVDGQLIGTVGLYKDISQLKKTEEALRQSREKFERLFMNNPEAAVYLDLGFHILDVNPRFTELFSYSLHEVAGRHINDVIVPKGKMREAETFDEKASTGQAYQEDTVRKRKDGTLVPVSFSASPIIVKNKVTGHVAVYKDISRQKKIEEALKKALERLEKMNEKLRVVGGLTRHDARNKLSAITGNVYLAKRTLADNPEALEHLSEIESSCRQAVRIFDFAGAYERLGLEELAYINVEKAVGGAVSLFTDSHGVEGVNECHGLVVLADSLLRQLFYNLIDNSLKHGEKVTRIRVHYKEMKDRLELVYEDDGIGVATAEKERVFKQGYGKDTGYGLYLIRKICEVYGWSIRETGKPGTGAQFTITIPKTNKNGKERYELN